MGHDDSFGTETAKIMIDDIYVREREVDIRQDALSKAIHLISLGNVSLWINSPVDIVRLANNLEKYVKEGYKVPEYVVPDETYKKEIKEDGNVDKAFSYEGFVEYAKNNFVSPLDPNAEFKEERWMKNIYEYFLGFKSTTIDSSFLEYSLPRQSGVSTFLNLLGSWLDSHSKSVLVVNYNDKKDGVWMREGLGRKYDYGPDSQLNPQLFVLTSPSTCHVALPLVD